MDVILRIKALEDRISDLENPKPINFSVDGGVVLTITPDKHFLVNGEKTVDLRTVVAAFGKFARVLLKEHQPQLLTPVNSKIDA